MFLFGVSVSPSSASGVRSACSSRRWVNSFDNEGIVDGAGFAGRLRPRHVVGRRVPHLVDRARPPTRSRATCGEYSRTSTVSRASCWSSAGCIWILYGWWEIRIQRGDIVDENPVQDRITDLQEHMQNWIAHVGGWRSGCARRAIAAMFVWALRSTMERSTWLSLAAPSPACTSCSSSRCTEPTFVILGVWHFLEEFPSGSATGSATRCDGGFRLRSSSSRCWRSSPARSCAGSVPMHPSSTAVRTSGPSRVASLKGAVPRVGCRACSRSCWRMPGVREEVTLRGRVRGSSRSTVGTLEKTTDEVARGAAELSGSSYYGVIHPEGPKHHVPSTRFRPVGVESARSIRRPRRHRDRGAWLWPRHTHALAAARRAEPRGGDGDRASATRSAAGSLRHRRRRRPDPQRAAGAAPGKPGEPSARGGCTESNSLRRSGGTSITTHWSGFGGAPITELIHSLIHALADAAGALCSRREGARSSSLTPRGCSESDRASGRACPARTRSVPGPRGCHPQCGGRGTSRSANSRLVLGEPLIEGVAGPSTGELCCDDQAPIWLPRGREAKYSSDSSVDTRAAGPWMCTWR